MNDLISRADAIAYIDRVIKSGLGRYKSLNYIRKYISALPSADAVSREEYEELYRKAKEVNGMANDILADFPSYKEVVSADAVQGEWNTGKPTKSGKYIVTLIGVGDYRFVDIMHYDKPCMPNREVSGECWYRDDDEWGDVVYDGKDIIAWIPLPKPYKGGAE